jgi:hypothetical protein
MTFDAPLLATELADVPAEATSLECLGYDGIYSSFAGHHDPIFSPSCAVQSAKCSPNIGKPLLDSAFVASS